MVKRMEDILANTTGYNILDSVLAKSMKTKKNPNPIPAEIPSKMSVEEKLRSTFELELETNQMATKAKIIPIIWLVVYFKEKRLINNGIIGVIILVIGATIFIFPKDKPR